MATAPEHVPLIDAKGMEIVERVLEMSTGYVLDFNNRTFDDFIAREVGVDATAPRYSIDGESKAKRLRRILHSLPATQQAKLLRSLLAYRDGPARPEQLRLLDDEWRKSYNDIVEALDNQVASADKIHASSAWTGRRTIREQVIVVRELAPIALRELDGLADLVESRRYNDPLTAAAVECLRELHGQLGELLAAVDDGRLTIEAVEAIERNKQRLAHLVKEGAKLTIVAPAMTFGIMHLLSWLTGVPVDSTLASSVFATVVGAEALKSIGKNSSIAAA